ncbi:Sac domain-containing Phosphoinositide Phosphatase [Klebsormidium nitens]|uniref:Sac domain-containing Phosphoinositide Phosphatase n=1 Tax=Klebsormidium nitens TaxID=105231 RepID=A0A1Y1ID29_KLENI|nr:Sac domain-containing Phosphoinositide Phosphatase [Klebsormidium nitens]|eukprot:GAQ88865.1 Sac domain-containing Phosphoinositide Phosphatase [Klebsormidium nitens]
MGGDTLHAQFYLEESPSSFVLKAANGSPSQALIVDRKTGDVSTKSVPAEPLQGEKVYGVVGMIKLIAGTYVIVITNRELVATLRGQPVYQITGTRILQCSSSSDQLSSSQKHDEEVYLTLLRHALAAPGLYFSPQGDITLNQQSFATLDKEDLAKPEYERAEPRFFWNRYLVEPLIKKRLDPFIIPIMQGSVQTLKAQGIKNKALDLTLIARRSSDRIGTRMWRRGADKAGNVANFVETEQLVLTANHVASYIQVRGSIPIFWDQVVDLKWKPKIRTVETSTSMSVAKQHFEKLSKAYGGIVAVDLVNQKGGEAVLGSAYKKEMAVISETNAAVSYWPFDFHKECGRMHFEKVNILWAKIRDAVEGEHKYFLARDNGEVLQLQKGVVRTNCIDCLDRTNVFQSVLARKALEAQLFRLGVFSESEIVAAHPTFDVQYKILWADHGDAISLQYAGTGALKGDFVRYGTRSFRGLLQDGVNALTRYYYNNFTDGHRQDALDLVTGHYTVTDDSPPLRGGNLTVWTPLVLTGLIATATLAIWNATRGITNLNVQYFAWAFLYIGFAYFTFSFIKRHGQQLCDRPRLCNLR